MLTFTQQLSDVWQGMSLGRRIALIVICLVSAGLIIAVGYWASQPDFHVLYSGLSADDSAAVIQKLQGQGVPYRLAAGGSTVMVPADQVQQRRIELAGEDIPVKGGKGFGLFDNPPLGMTPFVQHVNYLRALQAELAKTISQIDPVASARVHIVRPDPSPFIRDQKPTTASIVLRLKPGATLARSVGAGIVAMVSRSVEGLNRENVTLIDANGRLLTDDQGAESGAITGQMDYRRELENYLATRAESMLAHVLGAGRAVVRVTADINFQRHKEKKETYNPEGRVVTSEKVKTMKNTSSGGGAQGPAGAKSNLKGGASTGSSTGSNNVEETIETGFAVSKVTQEFEDKMGTIERLTIAAMVDLTSKDKDGKVGTEPKLALADAQEMIKQAVGFKAQRDEIKVSEVKLPGPAAPLPVENEDLDRLFFWQNIGSIVRNASMGIAALVALLLGWMILRRLKPVAAPAQNESTDERPASRQLEAAAQRDPKVIAQVLKSWLDQGDGSRRAA